MTSVRYTQLRCDGPRCRIRTPVFPEMLQAEVRARVRQSDGWHLWQGDRDLCPKCWDKRELATYREWWKSSEYLDGSYLDLPRPTRAEMEIMLGRPWDAGGRQGTHPGP